MNKKDVNLIAGVVFLMLAVLSVSTLVKGVAGGMLRFSLISIIMSIYGILITAALAACALRQKKRGKVLGVLAILYAALRAINFVMALPYVFSLTALLSLAAYIAAFVFTAKVDKEELFTVRDTDSEAAKTQLQSEKQIGVYEQLLSQGVITQEEFNQVTSDKEERDL